MLEFLQRPRLFYYFDVYTYLHWIKDLKKIELYYALLKDSGVKYTDSGLGNVYSDLFDQMVDSVVFAMWQLGYTGIPIFIAETGWPTPGITTKSGRTITNSATYNRNVVRKLATPARPSKPMKVLIFTLFNENMKVGPSTKRHFGLLYPNRSRVYDIVLSGRTKGKIWCVAAAVNETAEARPWKASRAA